MTSSVMMRRRKGVWCGHVDGALGWQVHWPEGEAEPGLTVTGDTHMLEEERRVGCKGSGGSSLTRGEFV